MTPSRMTDFQLAVAVSFGARETDRESPATEEDIERRFNLS